MRRRMVSGLMLACVLLTAFAVPSSANTTLGTANTPLTGASRAKRTNIALAVEAINGVTVAGDGGYFSFNDTVGPRTSSYGYKNAPNGRGVKVTGGGVAQAASTLYMALEELSGITYDSVETYSVFTDNYVTSKKYAVLVDYKAGSDFSFYNDSGITFRIDMWMGDEYVYCALVTPDDESDMTSESPGYSSINLNGNDALIGNITLAADSINDTALNGGDVFSFNAVVGPRTERYGYRSAVNGRGVNVVGGGVAQVASALYLAVKDIDSVTVLDKTTYTDYNQRYVARASDAIAVDYQNDIDFSFRYDGYGTLYVYTYVSGGTLYCELVEV